ncbi:MAG: aromatic aminobenezylarsenical efflux permease ArsG family transporter [Candidatus Marinimicrobia bacterium]|jgi:cytochrome c biogenesis protein CcdA|nr:aromatic aminobenezylarsenical efflux permease ArsG family transporter [Candidatus Neomarinimicrobiota bacterium]MDD4960946.1 aromatic aminobenezylarsenical efflux permease ArsG family transporter [Candidatus Neomarinimicrobiota bacterium]MDD5708925.1 aromatic aminobenezylarsenical efflux permease ArsG family transporter [Candidatus Neomarinimicrobiota bacterium]MDX9777481.1 aromatic aminobenezylarsenical efflux permease ArsG family transporter [bacterium]
MNELAIFTALWLGLLTAVSPCPLATNIAAISFIARKAGHKPHVLASGLLYALGRTLIYVLLGAGIAAGLLANAEVSRFLQKHMNEILGPVLILLGMVLLNWLGAGISFTPKTDGIQKKAEKGSVWFALPIGALFALTFCPVSAGLFFGGLVPLAVREGSIVMFPLVYGLGTALPVILFAFLLAFAAKSVSKVFNSLTHIEVWVRKITGAVFIAVGIYYSLVHIYGLSLK